MFLFLQDQSDPEMSCRIETKILYKYLYELQDLVYIVIHRFLADIISKALLDYASPQVTWRVNQVWSRACQDRR